MEIEVNALLTEIKKRKDQMTLFVHISIHKFYHVFQLCSFIIHECQIDCSATVPSSENSLAWDASSVILGRY